MATPPFLKHLNDPSNVFSIGKYVCDEVDDVELKFVWRSILSWPPLFAVVERKNKRLLKEQLKMYIQMLKRQGLPVQPVDYDEKELMVIAASRYDVHFLDCMLELGADVNVTSKSGQTPLYRACTDRRLEKNVKILLDHGADVNQPNSDGTTCLMNAVGSLRLCQILLENGAKVNAKNDDGDTALLHAIRKANFQVVKLLLEHGSDPLAQNNLEHDALLLSSTLESKEIYEHVSKRWKYPSKSKVKALELLGCSHLINGKTKSAYKCWRKALKIRDFSVNEPEKPMEIALSTSPYKNEVIFSTVEELERLYSSEKSMRLQGILISERILSPVHYFSLEQIYGLIKFNKNDDYESCLTAFVYFLRLCSIKCEFLALYVALVINEFFPVIDNYFNDHQILGADIRLDLIAAVAEILSDGLQDGFKVTNTLRGYQHAHAVFNTFIQRLTSILYILYNVSNTDDELALVKKMVKKTVGVHSNRRETVLHFALMRNRTSNVLYRGFINLLLESGHQVNQLNSSNFTPFEIFVAKCDGVYREEEISIVKLLLNHGVHIHRKNNNRGVQGVISYFENELITEIFAPMTLKCFAAQVIVRHNVPYENVLPRSMNKFVQEHF